MAYSWTWMPPMHAELFFSVQPLSDALHFGFKEVAELLRSRGGRVIVSLESTSSSAYKPGRQWQRVFASHVSLTEPICCNMKFHLRSLPSEA
jgi:hypothetical protein